MTMASSLEGTAHVVRSAIIDSPIFNPLHNATVKYTDANAKHKKEIHDIRTRVPAEATLKNYGEAHDRLLRLF